MKVFFNISAFALIASVSFPSFAQSASTMPAQSLNQLTFSGLSTETDLDGCSTQNAFDGGGARAELQLQWQNDWYVGVSGQFSEVSHNDIDMLTDQMSVRLGTQHF